MDYISGKRKKTITEKAPKKAAPVERTNLPKGYEVLPKELHAQPALKGRKTMKGVALPKMKEVRAFYCQAV